jgi:hypothetical protein
MSGPCSAAGTSSPFLSLGVAVTYPRHPMGRMRSPFRGVGWPLPQLMPKKPTRIESMRPALGGGVAAGVGVALGAGVALGLAEGLGVAGHRRGLFAGLAGARRQLFAVHVAAGHEGRCEQECRRLLEHPALPG